MKKYLSLLLLFVSASCTMTPVPAMEKISHRDVDCLAKNLYHEARGESDKGLLAVAAVTMNRVAAKGFPSTVCGVVYDKGQFSWVQQLRDHTPKHKEAYKRVKYLAMSYLSGTIKDPTNGALYYHAYYVKPYWTKTVKLTTRIDSHLFYSKQPMGA